MKFNLKSNYKQTEIGKLPKEWEIKKLKELLIIKGRIGWKGLKKSEFSNKGIIIINGPNIKNKKIGHGSTEFYVLTGKNNMHVKPFCIIISCVCLSLEKKLYKV